MTIIRQCLLVSSTSYSLIVQSFGMRVSITTAVQQQYRGRIIFGVIPFRRRNTDTAGVSLLLAVHG
jgi:hypothetical protein